MFRPELADKPLAVAGNPDKRHGVVLAKNAIAKKAGVKTGDVIWEAKQKCDGLIIVPPHFDLYADYSKRVFDIYTHFTPQVEPFGPDECWLDCSGCQRLFGQGTDIAKKILNAVKSETGLTVSVGVSFTKPLAKLCSDLAEPNGFFEATEADFKQKLWQLPVKELIMVGRRTAEKLHTLNIYTLGDLANADERLLKHTLGINGIKLRDSALGCDGETVRQYDKSRKQESVGHGMTTSRDVTGLEELHSLLFYLAEKISARMIKHNVKGCGIHVDLRSYALTHVSKQKRLTRPIFSSSDITEQAFMLAKELLSGKSTPLRTVSISVYDLCPMDGGVQLSFFDDKPQKRENLELALNKIRNKYGRSTIQRASLVECDFIYDKEDSEDFLPFKR